MASSSLIKPTHKAIRAYYETLRALGEFRVRHEGALETAFSRLLADTARPHSWTLIPKQKLKVGKHPIYPEGALRDLFTRRGFWEAKDTETCLTDESC
jgi:hypothetical protein